VSTEQPERRELYVWKQPREIDAARAEALLAEWRSAGADPGAAPFESSSDVGWFYREVLNDRLRLEASSDAEPTRNKLPIWLAADADPPPARMVSLLVGPETSNDDVDTVFGLAMKYDLVVYDPASRRVHLPMDEMAAYASATFWPRGAIQAAVAGSLGGAIGFAAWMLSVPVLSGLVAIAGAFMFAMAVFTFVVEIRKRRSIS
jgi:hypothetical protein